MKNTFLILIFYLLTLSSSIAQAKKLVPSKDAFESKWITNENYDMIWYALKDTAKFEMGRVSTEVRIVKDQVLAITNVKLKNLNAPWVDSTTAELKTLKPIRHSSYNMQRDMVLNFGTVVKGYYYDKAKNARTEIDDPTHESCFDSNLYPLLLRWLELKEDLKRDIAIYDYNPSLKIGVMSISIENTKGSEFQSKKLGLRKVWKVAVKSEVGKDQFAESIYYVDKADHRLWKQEINMAGRTMQMIRVEE